MCELEIRLSREQRGLLQIDFHQDEANIDKNLKRYLKSYMITSFSRVENHTLKMLEIKELGGERILPYSAFKEIYIKHVYLPEEITEAIKSNLKRNRSITYTNPDLLLELSDGLRIEYISVELKSTKNNKIPGSSIQQVNPTQWVIFIRHSNTHVEVSTGHYLNTISSRLQFPDRSPRPEVSYRELSSWNYKNRTRHYRGVKYDMSDTEDYIKIDLLTDWQDVLAKRWVDIIFAETKERNIPWFSNNIRKFIVRFLDRYEQLSEEEKSVLKEKVASFIE